MIYNVQINIDGDKKQPILLKSNEQEILAFCDTALRTLKYGEIVVQRLKRDQWRHFITITRTKESYLHKS